eukprot:ANDGO_06364.mRNA.1 Metal tolerance protein 8
MTWFEDVLPRKGRQNSSQSLQLAFVFVYAVACCLRTSSMSVISSVMTDANRFIYLFLIFAFSGVFFMTIQQPWKRKKELSTRQWFRVVVNSTLMVFIVSFWLSSVKELGLVRSVIAEAIEFPLHTFLLFLTGRDLWSDTKTRASLFLGFGLLLLLLSSDPSLPAGLSEAPAEAKAEDVADQGASEDALSLSPSSLLVIVEQRRPLLGLFYMFVACLLSVVRKNSSKKLAIEVGGAKRLTAITFAVSGALLFPFFVYSRFRTSSEFAAATTISSVLTSCSLAFLLIVVPYYMEVVTYARVSQTFLARISLPVMFCFMFLLSIFSGTYVPPILAIAAFVVVQVSILLFSSEYDDSVWSGWEVLTSYLPFASEVLTSKSVIPQFNARISSPSVGLSDFFSHVAKNADARSMAAFLVINFLFMGVEFLYGWWNNSLGLISDAFHMAFDCIAVLVSLISSFLSMSSLSHSNSRVFSYGYSRYVVVGGLVNGILLLCVGSFILMEAFQRMLAPELIHTHRLMFVSFLGLLVNLSGIVFFSSAHAHAHDCGHGGCQGHDHHQHQHQHQHQHSHHTSDHEHSHDCADHEYDGPTYRHPHSSVWRRVVDRFYTVFDKIFTGMDLNLRGLVLHMMADTLGSIGVMASSYMITNHSFHAADAIVSFAIASLVIASALPLVRESVDVLLQRGSEKHLKRFRSALQEIGRMPGVVEVHNERLWTIDGSRYFCSAGIQIADNADDQQVLSLASSLLRKNGIQEPTVQIEKSAFTQKMSSSSLQNRIMFGSHNTSIDVKS